MKKFILLLILILTAAICPGKSLTSVGNVYGNTVNNIQNAWVIADSETSAGTEASALSVTERTKKIVDALIVAASSGDDEISVFPIPPAWTTMRFRAIGITDGGTRTDQIYFGSLGGDLDTELNHSVQLAWTTGTQRSTYSQIAFTLGGADGAAYVPQIGDTVTGNTSGETAVIVSVVETASTWGAGTAAGTVTYRSASGAFTNSETISILKANKVLASDAYKHAASDVVHFEMADTLTRTAKSWTQTWTEITPADDTNAESAVSVIGADYMVIVTTATSVDTKLLVKGYGE